MPTFDYVCYACDWHRADCYVPRFDTPVQCPQGHDAEKLWTKSPHVIPDTFTTPLVDDVMDKTRRVFHTRSERRDAMRELGLREGIRHVGETPGSDKSRHTSRWL